MKSNITSFYNPTEKVLVRSEGCYQYDAQGKRYIDFESGVWCTNLGHSNREVNSFIKEHIDTLMHQGYKFRNNYSEELSVKLQSLIGFNGGSSVFLSSGSEAVNLSIMVAQHLTGRSKILKVSNSYLSAYGFGQIKADNEHQVNIGYNDYNSVNSVDFTDIAAFVIETGGASVDMVKFPDKEFVEELVKKSKSCGTIIIVDEVTTGIGRHGTWFGFQHYDIVPEVVVTGKALGNGFPISAVTFNADITKRFSSEGFIYAQSHQNDPLGCAIGLKVIDEIETKGYLLTCKERGDYFEERLNYLMSNYSKFVNDVRARGLMLAIEFTDRVDGVALHNTLFDSGFVVGFKNNTLRFLPPFTISDTDIDSLIDCIETFISKSKA